MSAAREHVLVLGDVELAIDLSLGARATRWIVDGLSLLAVHGSGPVEYGMYPMAPWAGRLRDNRFIVGDRTVVLPATRDEWALHGTALAGRFTTLEVNHTPDSASLTARCDQHLGWPWPMQVDVSWELRARELITVITVRALDRPFPVNVGWHPWFARRLDRGQDLEWQFSATAMAERGPDHLPTGQMRPFDPDAGPFDDAFVVPDGRATLRWPGAMAIDIHNEAPWFVVFDELDLAVCLEPQSGPPDGLNDGLGYPIAIASPDRPHTMTTRWIMRDEPPEDRG